jgi:hypothetical protein
MSCSARLASDAMPSSSSSPSVVVVVVGGSVMPMPAMILSCR